jgi:hypothetical protein
MSHALPYLLVPRVAANWAAAPSPDDWAWDAATPLPPLILADGSGPASQQTTVRVCYNSQAFFVRFECEDRDIWGSYTERDDPIYEEEVVEVFIAPGEATPVDYYEFEVSPLGTLLDLTVHNPDSDRATIRLDFGWNCPGLRWFAGRDQTNGRWWGVYVFPWAAIGAPGELPTRWRANFYRIERPHGAPAEFSCWSPTMTEPADFHKPAYFGVLELR